MGEIYIIVNYKILYMDFGKVKYIKEIFIINYCILGNGYKSYGFRFIVYFDISCIII